MSDTESIEENEETIEEPKFSTAWLVEEQGSDSNEAVIVWEEPDFSDLTEEQKEDILVSKIEYRIIPD